MGSWKDGGAGGKVGGTESIIQWRGNKQHIKYTVKQMSAFGTAAAANPLRSPTVLWVSAEVAQKTAAGE